MHLVHFGTFDVENYGDLLYPLIARHRLAAAGVDFTFVSPVGGPPVWEDCVATVGPSAVIETDVDGVMLGGGNIVHAGQAGVDAYRGSGLTALLAYTRLWLNPSEIAGARGIPLCWNAPGVPQSMTPRAAEVLRWAAGKARYLSVRDSPSLRNLRHAGVTGTVEVVPDSALEVTELWTEDELEGAHEALFAEARRGVPERTIAVHLNERYISGPAQSLAERLDRVAERLEATPVLLALGPCHGDGGVARSVGAKMKSEPLVVDRPSGLKQLVAALAASAAYLGSSMHGMITALAFGRPGILVAHEGARGGKFSGFLDHFQLGRWLVHGWTDVEARLGELLKAGPSEAGRVLPAAMPLLDVHWARMSETLLESKPRSGSRAKASRAPSVEGIVEEGIDALLAVADRERRRATAESARADDAGRRLTEFERAADTRVAKVRSELEARIAERSKPDPAPSGPSEREGQLMARTAELEASLEQRQGELEAARHQTEAAKSAGAERELALQRLDAATAENERRAAEVSALTDVLAQREDTFRTALEAQAEASRTVARLEGELTKAHASYADARALAGRLEAVEPQLEDARAQLADARRRLSARDAIVSSLSDAIEHTRAEQVAVEERLRAADDEVAEADRASQELEAEIHRMSAEIEDLRSASERAATADRETAAARDELSRVKEHVTKLEALQKSSVAREQALRNRLVLERDSLEERLETTLAALNEAKLPSAGHPAADRLEAERDRLQAELLTESATRQGLEEHLAALRQEIKERVRPVEVEVAEPPVASPVARSDAHESLELPVDTDPETAARIDFTDRYNELCRRSGLDRLPEAKRALPWPVFPPPPAGTWEPRASVIVCVHNALDHVRRCLESVGRNLTVDAEIVLVDDGSDAETAKFLDAVAGSNHRVRLITNAQPPHGYTVAANLGLRAARGELLVLLNSDTIVTVGWLERLIACADSDTGIGIVGPVSNAASHQSVPKVRERDAWATNPLPEWLTVEGMGAAVASASPQLRPRVPFVNGYCYAITRRALDAVGFLDEKNFAAGYCEENDFSVRARNEGFACAIADDAFVFHAKSRSYTPEGRDEHGKRNYARFMEKHGAATIQPLVDSLESSPPVHELGRRLEGILVDQGTLVAELHERLGGVVRPLFVLPGIPEGGSGGSHSIVQEVAGMRRLGVPAEIAISEEGIERARLAYPESPDLFTPYRGAKALTELAADAHVLVATHSDSVELVNAVLSHRPELVPAYYVQDYEPFFWDEGSENARSALASYTAFEGACVFAKTQWMCNVVSAAHRVPVHKVEPSVDRANYRPPEARSGAPERIVIAAMVRPRTPRRQPKATVRLLERLAATFGESLEIVTFGCPQASLEPLTRLPAIREGHRGMLGRPEVAELLRHADVFVDHSVYQAFGRTALEAMACECVPVVPVTGGTSEFAEAGVNALVCDTLDEDAVYSSASQLIEDAALRERLAAAGPGTAARYSVERAALSEFSLFASLLLRQQAGSAKGLVARAG